MEDILEVYHRPYDERFPLICLDESCKQLVEECVTPLPMKPGRPKRIDHEYIRQGVAQLFLAVEPLTGQRYVSAGEHRTRKDWAWFVRDLLDLHYPQAEKIRLVQDNLNTHTAVSLYETFPAPEARRLAERIEFHYTPKHGSWLNVAEIELSALQSQCLNRRIPSLAFLQSEIAAWQLDRNKVQHPIHWQFTTSQARVKLSHLYPQF
jgi:hypothetical protein